MTLLSIPVKTAVISVFRSHVFIQTKNQPRCLIYNDDGFTRICSNSWKYSSCNCIALSRKPQGKVKTFFFSLIFVSGSLSTRYKEEESDVVVALVRPNLPATMNSK